MWCRRPSPVRHALSRPIDPPLLVVLDEAANIAPLAELDGLAATCAAHGVQLVTVWQDLAQIAARYGARSATVVNNHRAKLFLAGIADPATLDHASQLRRRGATTGPVDHPRPQVVGSPRRAGDPPPTAARRPTVPRTRRGRVGLRHAAAGSPSAGPGGRTPEPPRRPTAGPTGPGPSAPWCNAVRCSRSRRARRALHGCSPPARARCAIPPRAIGQP